MNLPQEESEYFSEQVVFSGESMRKMPRETSSQRREESLCVEAAEKLNERL